MFHPIEKRARRALVSGSLAIMIGALVIVPMAGSPSGYARPAGTAMVSKFTDAYRADPWKAAIVTVSRDPFIVESSLGSAPMQAVSPDGDRRSVGMRVTQGQAVSPGTTGATVLGIALGDNPKAVVSVDGITRIVAAGDLIHGERIESILRDRVVLAAGSLLLPSEKSP